jgi:hypothetical protein
MRRAPGPRPGHWHTRSTACFTGTKLKATRIANFFVQNGTSIIALAAKGAAGFPGAAAAAAAPRACADRAQLDPRSNASAPGIAGASHVHRRRTHAWHCMRARFLSCPRQPERPLLRAGRGCLQIPALQVRSTTVHLHVRIHTPLALRNTERLCSKSVGQGTLT